MVRQLLRRLRYLLQPRRLDADLAEELAFHEALTRLKLETEGLTPSDARLAARRALGSRSLVADQVRDVWLPHWLQGGGRDLRLALRTLAATPLVTTVALLSLALSLGANTAIFSLISSVVFRPLPVRHA